MEAHTIMIGRGRTRAAYSGLNLIDAITRFQLDVRKMTKIMTLLLTLPSHFASIRTCVLTLSISNARATGYRTESLELIGTYLESRIAP